MIRQLLPISALLLGSAFLVFAGGVNGLLLPVRGAAEGFSALSLGLLGTGWAVGYILGCMFSPRLVASVGHVRAFGVMAALAAITVLMSLLLLTPYAWVPLRSISGFCFAAGAMIVESWLNERADAKSRGKVFGAYTMVNLIATTAGQMTLALGDPNGFFFFVLAAIVYCLALLPTAVSSSASPRPLTKVKLDLRALWRNSPVAVFAVLMVGVSNSAFGTLAAVYAQRIGLELTSVALFLSIPIIAAAAAQMPVGYLSDRVDRRRVLVGVAAVATAADLAFILLQPESRVVNLALSAVFGAAVYTLYPVIVAHASDHADPGDYIQTSGGLLLVYGVGAIAGPLAAGALMSRIGVEGLFLTSLAAHVLLIGFALWRIVQRAAVATEDKTGFRATLPARAATPETVAMADAEREAQDGGEGAG